MGAGLTLSALKRPLFLNKKKENIYMYIIIKFILKKIKFSIKSYSDNSEIDFSARNLIFVSDNVQISEEKELRCVTECKDT